MTAVEVRLARVVQLMRKVPCYERVTDSEPGGVTMSPIFNCGACDRCTFIASLKEATN